MVGMGRGPGDSDSVVGMGRDQVTVWCGDG